MDIRQATGVGHQLAYRKDFLVEEERRNTDKGQGDEKSCTQDNQ